MSKILYPVGTEVAIRVVSKPVKLIVKSYKKGSHTPYELKRADGKKSDHLKAVRYNVGQLISWKNHKTNETQTEGVLVHHDQGPSLTREDVAQMIDDVFDERMEDTQRFIAEVHSELHEIEHDIYHDLHQPVNENE